MRYVRYWIRWTLDFSQKFYSSDYLFFYAFDNNNVVVLVQNTTDITDTLEADMPYEEVVDTMVDNILDEMEWKNCKICNDYDSRCGEEHEIDDEN